MPALFSTTSRRPKRAAAASVKACTSASDETSTRAVEHALAGRVDLLRQRGEAGLVEVAEREPRALGGEAPRASRRRFPMRRP